jgi:hypothetical protein
MLLILAHSHQVLVEPMLLLPGLLPPGLSFLASVLIGTLQKPGT